MQCGQHVRTHENDCSFSHVEKCFMFAVLSAYIAKDSIFVNFGGLEMKIMHLFSLSSLFFPFQQPRGSLGDAKWARKLCKISLKRALCVCGWAKLLEWRLCHLLLKYSRQRVIMFLQETKAYLSSSRTSVNVFLTSPDDGLKVALFKKLCNGVHFGAQQRDARAEVNL